MDAFIVAESVSGPSSGWSEVLFDQPVAAIDDGLYAVMLFPAGGEFEYEGAGGGAGVGYHEGEGGFRGWFCIDGEQWVAMHEGFGIAFEPIFVNEEPWMLQKSHGRKLEKSDPLPEVTSLEAPFPNPCNPETEISFVLSQASHVEIDIYDIRGCLVSQLMNGHCEQGEHSRRWDGRDHLGRVVGSGVYLIQMKTREFKDTRRVLLLK